jgi:Tfp pilus assembly protein PilX
MNFTVQRIHRQRGAALATALFVLLALLIIGVSAARTALHAEKAARAERDRHTAFQGAEAALADAERDIEGGSDPLSERARLFAHRSSIGFTDPCGAGRHSANLGLCLPGAPSLAPLWQRVDLSGDDPARVEATDYGNFTGAQMAHAAGPLPARLPRYVIELMPLVRAGEDAGARTGNFYRITAIGFGSNQATRVVLQSFYLKAAPEQGAP